LGAVDQGIGNFSSKDALIEKRALLFLLPKNTGPGFARTSRFLKGEQ
jgi:hypothetical protein